MADWWDSTKDRMATLDKAAGDKGMGAIGMVSPLGKTAHLAKSVGPALRSGLSRIGAKQPAYSLPKSLDRINNQRFMTPELQQQMVFGAGRVPGAFSQGAGAVKAALKASPVAALGVGIGYNASDMGSANAVPAAEERLTVPSHIPNAPIDYRAAGMPYKGGDTAVGADDWRGYRDGRYVESGPRIIRKDGKTILTNVNSPNLSGPEFIRDENDGSTLYRRPGGGQNSITIGGGQKRTGTLDDGSTYTYWGDRPQRQETSLDRYASVLREEGMEGLRRKVANPQLLNAVEAYDRKVSQGMNPAMAEDEARLEALATSSIGGLAEARAIQAVRGRNVGQQTKQREMENADRAYGLEERKLAAQEQAIPAEIAYKGALAEQSQALAQQALATAKGTIPADQAVLANQQKAIMDNIRQIYEEGMKLSLSPEQIQANINAYLMNIRGKGKYQTKEAKEGLFFDTPAEYEEFDYSALGQSPF